MLKQRESVTPLFARATGRLIFRVRWMVTEMGSGSSLCWRCDDGL